MIQMRQDLVYYVVQKLYSKTFLVVKFSCKVYEKYFAKFLESMENFKTI